MSEEIWKPVRGFPIYEVSNLGNVRREGKILTPRKHPHGYRQVVLSIDGEHHYRYIHRLVADAFYEVNHIDGNKTNNRIDNLEYVTRSGNVQHALKNGLMKRGEAHHLTRLTDQQVREIRNDTNLTHKELAAKYGTTVKYVGSIKQNKKRIGA